MPASSIPLPKSKKANTIEDAVQAAKEIGYDVIILAVYIISGQGTGAAYNEDELRKLENRPLCFQRN
jgi:carbamoyl-phosphate synthase large subunit